MSLMELKGIGASDGIAIGPASIVKQRPLISTEQHIPQKDIEGEVSRFLSVIESCVEDLELLKSNLPVDSEEELAIVETHQMMLKDEHLVDKTLACIRDKSINCEWAFKESVQSIRESFSKVENEYFRERLGDVEFVNDRVLRKCLGQQEHGLATPGCIVIATNLSPTDTAILDLPNMLGLVTEEGGPTSHTAILARHHGIPAAVGVEGATSKAVEGELVILDGQSGQVFFNPSETLLESYKNMKEMREHEGRHVKSSARISATTLDGQQVELLANIGNSAELSKHSADGVGLFRSELAFLKHSVAPTEEEHYVLAKDCLETMGNKPVTFRMLDLGSDKIPPFLGDVLRERNPALGLRSMRLMLDHRFYSLFESQLRGLLRASVHGNLQLLLPLISGASELQAVLSAIDITKKKLKSDGVSFSDNINIGAMIETPSAVWNVEHMLPSVDFISIGCNDLVQYTMAADRENSAVAGMVDSFDPSILRSIAHVSDVARKANKPMSICGEIAGEPLALPLLIGLGVRSFSMAPRAIPIVSARLAVLDASKSKAWVADEVMACATGEAVKEKCASFVNKSI